MVKSLFLLLLVAFQVHATSSWQQQVQTLLPPPLEKLQPSKTTLQEAETILGKAHLVEGKDYYWERDGLKYALKLSVNDKGILHTIHFTFTGERPPLSKLNIKIPLDKFKPYPASGKSAGRFLIYKEKNSELIVDPISKTIHTVQLP